MDNIELDRPLLSSHSNCPILLTNNLKEFIFIPPWMEEKKIVMEERLQKSAGSCVQKISSLKSPGFELPAMYHNVPPT